MMFCVLLGYGVAVCVCYIYGVLHTYAAWRDSAILLIIKKVAK